MKAGLAGLLLLVAALLASILSVQIYFVVYKVDTPAATLFDLYHSILVFGGSLWQLLEPIIQLALILGVLLFFSNSSGLTQRLLEQRQFGDRLNTQSVIALIIIGSFAIAALTRPEAAAQLKEIALVVVGFYFGTRQRAGSRPEPAEGVPGVGGEPTGPAAGAPVAGPAEAPPPTGAPR